jgi:hypothetical protein
MHLVTHTHTQTHSVGLLWTRDRSVAEISLYLYNTQHLQKDKHPRPCSGFKHAIRASGPPQAYALDRAATGSGSLPHYIQIHKPQFAENPPLRVKGKAIPLQAWTGPEGSRRLRLPDFKAFGN